MKDFFDLLFASKVSPNGLLVLQMQHTSHNYPQFVNTLTEQRRLIFSGHLTEITTVLDHVEGVPDLRTTALALTDKGLHLLRDAELLMNKSSKAKKLAAIPFADWEDNIKIYLSLFPAGLQSSTPIRSPAKLLHERFKWFFLTFPEYSWNDVLVATDGYLKSLENSAEGFKYITTSKYFIKKQENDKSNTSKLGDWCQTVKDGALTDIQEQHALVFKTDAV